MKILITGGHLTPALSVIERIPKDWNILFVGRKYALEGDKKESLEYKTITEMGIKFVDLNAGRLQRFISRHTIPSLLRIPKAYVKSFQILKEYDPDVILGFGGYVSVPVIITGKFLKIPSVIHEQTLKIGMSNKILSKFADKILVSWESSLKYFPKNKTSVSGNPVRRDFFKKVELPIGSDPLVFIFGGSTGSHALNVLAEKIIDRLSKKYRILHMTGSMDFERLRLLSGNLENKGKYLVVENFSPMHMGFVLESSSLVISRSGINTVTELIKFEKPAILMPLPSGQKNEQEENARFLKELGLAEVIDQKSITPEILFETVEKMFSNMERYRLYKKDVLINDSAERILILIRDVANKKNKKEK